MLVGIKKLGAVLYMDVLRISGGHKFRLRYGPSGSVVSLKSPEMVAFSPRGLDYLKPKILVQEGQKINLGDPVVQHKKDPRIKFCAPASGVIHEIRFGPRRVLEAIVVAIDHKKESELETQKKFSLADVGALTQEYVETKLLDNGLWAYLDCFPGWKLAPLADSNTKIRAVHINLVRTEAHWPSSLLALENSKDLLSIGVKALSKISNNIKIYLPKGGKIAENITSDYQVIEVIEKYPADNLGVQAWYDGELEKNQVVVGADTELVLDIGYLFTHGKKRVHRTYSIAGDATKKPSFLTGRLGMAVGELSQNNITSSEDVRLIVGGLFRGGKVRFQDYLGEKDVSLIAMREDKNRIPFVFFRLGGNRLTLSKTWLAGFNTEQEREATTSNNGEERACIQCGYCIDICPVKLLPNMIMKAAVIKDVERMEESFIHDCVDCGLCTFVCPSKIELGHHIESGKALIEKEG